jgi:FMN-dependent NADH-azoreductase
MPKLLHIDSSPLYGRSVSRQLTDAFVTQWKSSRPNEKVVDRDLNATPIPPVTAEWVGAAYTPEEARTPQQRELLALSDTLLAELEQADEYVFGVPMHNFGVPSVLKALDRPDRARGQDFFICGWKAERTAQGQKGHVHHRDRRDL